MRESSSTGTQLILTGEDLIVLLWLGPNYSAYSLFSFLVFLILLFLLQEANLSVYSGRERHSDNSAWETCGMGECVSAAMLATSPTRLRASTDAIRDSSDFCNAAKFSLALGR